MAVAPWNPWTELAAFERTLDRIFDLPLHSLFGDGNDHHEPWQPRMDVHATDAEYVVEADLPGLSIHDITVQLDGTTLVIAGERKSAQPETSNTYTHAERPCGTFQRTYTLPTAVKSDEVGATYTNGVLTVTVPKADAARPRQITVQAA